MCFPCLRVIMTSPSATRQELGDGAVGDKAVVRRADTNEPGKTGKDGEKSGDDEIYRRAGISPRQMFRMMDGTTRKTCDRCARDIHENAVPCPHCTNFSEWCRTRHR